MREPNIVILIDVQNLYHSSLNYGNNKISYKKLLEKICKDRNMLYAKAYAAHKEIKNVKAFYKALEASGIEVHSKQIHVRKIDGKDAKIIPVHFDSEISVDACFVPEECDVVALCTGNGNFEYLVNKLSDEGIKVEVWSFKESTSDRLLNKGTFVPIPMECLEEEKVKTNAQ